MSSFFDKVRVLVRSKLTPSKSDTSPPPASIPQDWIDAAQKEVGTYSRADLVGAREAEQGVSERVNTVGLRQTMLNQFSLDDLNAVAEIMGVDSATLEGGKGRRVMALINLSEREGRLEELTAICKAMKPDAAWE